MGKKLVIKGANFSVNAIEDGPAPTPGLVIDNFDDFYENRGGYLNDQVQWELSPVASDILMPMPDGEYNKVRIDASGIKTLYKTFTAQSSGPFAVIAFYDTDEPWTSAPLDSQRHDITAGTTSTISIPNGTTHIYLFVGQFATSQFKQWLISYLPIKLTFINE